MTKDELKNRTKEFGKRIINMVNALPNNKAANVISYQIIRSATSVGANYRATCRSRSTAEFISKINIVMEEADETLYWLELLVETNLMKQKLLEELLTEANELTAIFASTLKTLRKNKSQHDRNLNS